MRQIYTRKVWHIARLLENSWVLLSQTITTLVSNILENHTILPSIVIFTLHNGLTRKQKHHLHVYLPSWTTFLHFVFSASHLTRCWVTLSNQSAQSAWWKELHTKHLIAKPAEEEKSQDLNTHQWSPQVKRHLLKHHKTYGHEWASG